jgi:hypothetical protein
VTPQAGKIVALYGVPCRDNIFANSIVGAVLKSFSGCIRKTGLVRSAAACCNIFLILV